MKKKLALLLVLVMAFMCVGQSVGAINVIMNSSFVEFPDQEPVIESGTTLVPIRVIAETLGLEVSWDDPTDTVILKKDNFYIELVIGSTTVKTSSGTKTLLTAPKIINGRTMVPLRFIAEELGLTVSWNDEYQRVVIAGEVDTQTVVKPPVEEPSDASEEVREPIEAGSEAVREEEPVEEETDYVEEISVVSVEGPSASVVFELPVTYVEEDADSEEGFAYRSLDAFDVQHTYNWEIVSRYESYADEAGTSGIIVIVQDNPPYEGEDYDVARIMDEYPEEPERPEVDFGYIMSEVTRLVLEQMYTELEVELPEDYAEMENEQHAEALGFASVEEMNEYMEGIVEGFDMMQIPEYAEYADWQMQNSEYRADVAEINNARSYAVRKFSDVQGQFDDETWAAFFSSVLNVDEEVRYDGVEIVDFDGKKVVKAIIYAEDPNDEQGVYEYYQFIDGDSVITIFGGTLNGSEPSAEISDVLSRLAVQ